MQPVARDCRPVVVRELDPGADPARLLLDHGQVHVEGVARPEAVGLGQGDGREHARAAQPGADRFERVGIEALAGGKARDLAQAPFAQALQAGHAHLAEGDGRAGGEGDARIDAVGEVVGGDVGFGDLGLGVALVAPAGHPLARRRLDRAGAGDLAGAIFLRQVGSLCHRRDGGAGKAELRPGLHLDQHLRDGVGGVERRDLRRLEAVEGDLDDGVVIAQVVERAEQAGIVGAGGGEDVLAGEAAVLQRAGDQRGIAEGPLERLGVVAGDAEVEPDRRAFGRVAVAEQAGKAGKRRGRLRQRQGSRAQGDGERRPGLPQPAHPPPLVCLACGNLCRRKTRRKKPDAREAGEGVPLTIA